MQGEQLGDGLTARGRHRGEECHSLGQQIQAASLISDGHPISPQARIAEQAHYEARCSC